MSGHHSYMQKEGKNGKPTGKVVRVVTADWARHRASGFIFCVKTEKFDPHAVYSQQVAEEKKDRSEAAAEKLANKGATRAELKKGAAEKDVEALRTAAQSALDASDAAHEAHEEAVAAAKKDKKDEALKLAVTAALEASEAADAAASEAVEAVEAAEAALIAGE